MGWRVQTEQGIPGRGTHRGPLGAAYTGGLAGLLHLKMGRCIRRSWLNKEEGWISGRGRVCGSIKQ